MKKYKFYDFTSFRNKFQVLKKGLHDLGYMEDNTGLLLSIQMRMTKDDKRNWIKPWPILSGN